jgi:hypothetical protein
MFASDPEDDLAEETLEVIPPYGILLGTGTNNETGAASQVENASPPVRPQPSPQAAVVPGVPPVFFIVLLILIRVLAHR